MRKLKLAVVGHGFVGTAVDSGFNDELCEKMIIDPNYDTSITDLPTNWPDLTFVCVPTPMGDDGSIDSSIVDATLFYLLENVSGLIVLKSTVIPSIIKQYEHYENFIYNPEFLTERNAKYDFKFPFMHVFGGKPSNCDLLKAYYDRFSHCLPCDVYSMTPMEASFVKYGINSFLATKVSWFNQFYDLVQTMDCDYNTIIDAIGADARVSSGHTKVPGPDGRRLFGGACFTKDTNALMAFSKAMQSELTILEEAITVNNVGRSQYELDDREKAQNVSYTLKEKQV